MAKVTVSFTLDTERDKRLVRWLDSFRRGEKSTAIRKVLNDYLGQNDVTLRDIYNELQELKRSGVVVSQSGEPTSQSDLPADVLENLANLGK